MIKPMVFVISLLVALGTSLVKAANSEVVEKATDTVASAEASQCPELKQFDATNLQMVSQVLNSKKPYAALALIESLNTTSPQLDLLKANSLRQINKSSEAEVIYNKLLDSCVAAYAYQGLGWVSSFKNSNQQAARQLKVAAKLLPINSAIRSDYGFALMQIGDYQSAFNEYLTAIELDDKNLRAKYNLVSLMYKTNQTEKAEQLAKRYEISQAEMQEIRADNIGKSSAVKYGSPDTSARSDTKTVCNNKTEKCTGILSMKLGGYTYE